MIPLHLPDVSEFQANVDWPQVVRHNGGAAIVRAYNGRRADRLWPGRRAAARKAGVTVLGIYAYMVSDRPALKQAQEFAALVGTLSPGEFVVLDLEEGSGDQRQRADTFLTYCDARLTYPGYHGAWLYSGAAFFKSHGLLPIATSTRHTWVAAYGQGEPKDVPHTLWQHTSSESWPGIGRCDCSVFNGNLAQLAAKVWAAPKAAPAPKPTPVVVPPAPPSWWRNLYPYMRNLFGGKP